MEKYISKQTQGLLLAIGLFLFCGVIYMIVNKDIVVMIPSLQSLPVQTSIDIDIDTKHDTKKVDERTGLIVLGIVAFFFIGMVIANCYNPSIIGVVEFDSVLRDIKSKVGLNERDILELGKSLRQNDLKMREMIDKIDIVSYSNILSKIIEEHLKKK